MKLPFKWIVGGAVVLFGLLQTSNPRRVNPPPVPGRDLLATNPPPPEIAALLRNACYDCHSDETRWPWYSRVAPLSWMVVDHVNEGRRHLNFSDWPHDDPQRARKKWNHVADELRSGDMPLPSYTWIHPPARITPKQREQLAGWAEQQARRLAPDPAKNANP